MKKLILTGVAILTLTACTDKVAFVDNSKLLNEYQEKKDIEAKLKTEVDAYKKKRDSINIAYETEANKFLEQAKTMPESVAKKRYNELMQKRQILEQHLQQEEMKIQMESQTQMDSLLNKVKKNIKEYGKQKGYTFILGANDGGSVLYGADNKDITKEVTEYLNNQYKSGKK